MVWKSEAIGWLWHVVRDSFSRLGLNWKQKLFWLWYVARNCRSYWVNILTSTWFDHDFTSKLSGLRGSRQLYSSFHTRRLQCQSSGFYDVQLQIHVQILLYRYRFSVVHVVSIDTVDHPLLVCISIINMISYSITKGGKKDLRQLWSSSWFIWPLNKKLLYDNSVSYTCTL
jgi:hypothetical protein